MKRQPQTKAARAAHDSREPGAGAVRRYPGGDAQKESGGQRWHEKAETLHPREEVSGNPPNLLDGAAAKLGQGMQPGGAPVRKVCRALSDPVDQ